jgi:hypothetical protein
VISTSTSTSLRAGLRASHPAQDGRIFDHELFVWLFIAAGTQLLLVSYNRRSGKATLMSCRACENDFAPVQTHEIARFSEFVLPIVQAKRQIRFVFLIPPAHGWSSMPWLPVRRKFLQLRNTTQHEENAAAWTQVRRRNRSQSLETKCRDLLPRFWRHQRRHRGLIVWPYPPGWKHFRMQSMLDFN